MAKGVIAENCNNFAEDALKIYGTANTFEAVNIIASVLREHCQKAGVNYKKMVSYLNRKNALITDKGRSNRVVRIGTTTVRCISLKKSYLSSD